MHKLVYTAFKTIFLSMMFIFIFDMAFYLYRAFSVNQRMESIMTSLQKVVMENNYLPYGDYIMYSKMLEQLSEDMNSSDTFISGIGTNYNRDADGATIDHFRNTAITKASIATGFTTSHLTDRMRFKMSKPANYGDVMICQAKVQITQPIWGFGDAATTANTEYTNAYPDYNGQDSTYWNRIGYKRTTLYYNYYVPCLHYQSIH